jgi:hypothetical protein
VAGDEDIVRANWGAALFEGCPYVRGVRRGIGIEGRDIEPRGEPFHLATVLGRLGRFLRAVEQFPSEGAPLASDWSGTAWFGS